MCEAKAAGDQTAVGRARRATGNLSQNDTEADENRDSELLEQANTFLTKLLSSCLGGDRLAASTAKSLVEDLSEIETALWKRMSATLEAAARVLEAEEEAASASKRIPADCNEQLTKS